MTTCLCCALNVYLTCPALMAIVVSGDLKPAIKDHQVSETFAKNAMRKLLVHQHKGGNIQASGVKIEGRNHWTDGKLKEEWHGTSTGPTAI